MKIKRRAFMPVIFLEVLMFERLDKIMETLLGENGCPWDIKQTHLTLRENMLEEAQEAVEAIDSGDMDALKEELGDVLLQVVFHAKIAEKAGSFKLEDVVDGLCDKLVRRHTHVFGDEKALTEEDALRIWQMNKKKELS